MARSETACNNMQRRAPQDCDQLMSLNAMRERRQFIPLANADDDWRQTRACFASARVVVTDDDAERAGRVIAGDKTLGLALQDVRSLRLVR